MVDSRMRRARPLEIAGAQLELLHHKLAIQARRGRAQAQAQANWALMGWWAGGVSKSLGLKLGSVFLVETRYSDSVFF